MAPNTDSSSRNEKDDDWYYENQGSPRTQACAAAFAWAQALALLRDEVQEVAYNSAITACDNGGEWERALLLLQELERRGLCSTTTFNATLSACASASAWEAAALLFARAVRGHAADALTCNAYLKGLAAS
ncbi:hypothetical protein AK812_SmicGene45777, partial [Symbiodinium microadriaticum]